MRILHMLGWKLKEIIPELYNINNQGFDVIQINVIQPSKEDGLREWWMSYQPIGFEIGNFYGNSDDLKELCYKAEQYKIKIVVDVICNHMGAKDNNSLLPHDKVSSKLKNNPNYWKKRKNIINFRNRFEVINYCINLPGLETSNPDVQEMVIKYLKDLIDCGVSGFRFDAAKHIALPSEGCNFWPRIVSSINNYQNEKSNRNKLILYGEVIFEDDNRIIDEYCQYINVLTNYGGSDANKMVYFYESHDTYLSNDIIESERTRNLLSLVCAKKYAELNKKYPNTIFFIRPLDNIWKSELIKRANLEIDIE